MKMKAIFLGPPGVGKGTYSSRISERLKIPHVSTGDLFRDEVKKNSSLGKIVSDYMQRGELVPDNVTVRVLEERLAKPDCNEGFILDGFPRTIGQAVELDKIAKIDVVVNLNQPDRIIIAKLTGRRICRNCGEIYNIADVNEIYDGVRFVMPPILPKNDMKCDKDCGELIQRDDDRKDVIMRRLEVYKKQSRPLIDYYAKRGLLRDVFITSSWDLMIPKIIEAIMK